MKWDWGMWCETEWILRECNFISNMYVWHKICWCARSTAVHISESDICSLRIWIFIINQNDQIHIKRVSVNSVALWPKSSYCDTAGGSHMWGSSHIRHLSIFSAWECTSVNIWILVSHDKASVGLGGRLVWLGQTGSAQLWIKKMMGCYAASML